MTRSIFVAALSLVAIVAAPRQAAAGDFITQNLRYTTSALHARENSRLALPIGVPSSIAPIIVEMTIRVSFAVMLFATLSFLGLGAQPPAAEWGLMVSEARRYMHMSAGILIWPSVAIAIVAVGFNLLGDGLRDALNPRT